MPSEENTAARRCAARRWSIPSRNEPDPQPGDPISISREEFDAAYDELAAQGVPVKPDCARAWQDFGGWWVNYDAVLLALADLTTAPYAPWSSDRSLGLARVRRRRERAASDPAFARGRG